MTILRPILPALLVLPCGLLRADYADDTGYTALKAALGTAVPTGAGVGVSQVEGDLVTGGVPDYVPQAGTGTFAGAGTWAGKTFSAKGKGGVAANASWHAAEVALHLYGPYTSPVGAPNGFSSMSPGVTQVDLWLADSWDDDFLAPLATNRGAPLVEVRKVQNHSWIVDATNTAEADYFNDLLRRQDFAIERDGYLCVTALNNYSSNPVPALMASAYNPICAGLTNGAHSRNGVLTNVDGGGRRKPEIVVPVGATSYAAGYLSSAGALLMQKAATLGSTGAGDPRTIKAVLLAGATKSEFPSWSKTAAHPIDAVYGAGELNILSSYRILSGGKQAANAATGSALEAWDFLPLPESGTADYRLNIPAGMYGVELSAFAVWHRQPTDTARGPAFELNNPVLADYNLSLLRDPAAGGSAADLDSSTGTLYNLEHVRAVNLPAGNYRLHLSRGSDGAEGTHNCSIAWRLTLAPHEPVPVMARSGEQLNFTFSGLLNGQPYKFQSSANLSLWNDESTFTGGGTVPAITRPGTQRQFFRLLPVLP